MMPPGLAYGAGAVLGPDRPCPGPASLAGTALPAQHAPAAGLYGTSPQDSPQPPQALFMAGLPLDPETHPAIARYHPPGGPALRPARWPLSMGAQEGGRLGIDPDPESSRCFGPGLVESAGSACRRSVASPPCMLSSRTSRTCGWTSASGWGIPWCWGPLASVRPAGQILITQDIRRGDVVIVFDPKGDAGLLRRVYAEAKRAGRTKDFYMFHLGFPQVSARYNAIGNFSRITEVATRIANQLPSEGNSAAFKEFAWRFVNIIARALVALNRRPDYQQVRRYINDIEPLFTEYAEAHLESHGAEDWKEQVEELSSKISERNLPAALRGRSKEAIALMRHLQAQDLYDPVLDGLVSAFKYDKTYFDKIVSSVGPLMEKLTTGNIAELISPDYLDKNDTRPIFEWMEVIRRKGIVYVGLDALTDTTVASAVGNSMFADLVSVAGHIYKHGVDGESIDTPPTISMHADEFNELIGDEFVPLRTRPVGPAFRSRPTPRPGRMSKRASAIVQKQGRSPVTSTQ